MSCLLEDRGENKLSKALARLANTPGVFICELAKALASYKKKRDKKKKVIQLFCKDRQERSGFSCTPMVGTTM